MPDEDAAGETLDEGGFEGVGVDCRGMVSWVGRWVVCEGVGLEGEMGQGRGGMGLGKGWGGRITKGCPDGGALEGAAADGGGEADGVTGFVLVEGEDVVVIVVDDAAGVC